MNFSIINILDLIDSIGEENTKTKFEEFECSQNPEIEYFLKNNAISFAQRKVSITYLLFNEKSEIVAFFTIANKVLEIDDSILSSTLRKKIQRFSKIDENKKSYTTPAFLIAQFGKNFKNEINKNISGFELMDYVFDILFSIQRAIGGGIVFLECEDKQKLLDFYTNPKNNFRIFGSRISDSEKTKYIQLLRFL